MVRLEGDVAAVKDAYRVDSKRFPDNVVASCVTSELIPVKLWMVNSAGQVMFPAWPSSPCGFQVGPLDSLRSLHEVERVRTSLSLSPTMANCDRSSALQFDRTDAREVDKAREQFERGEVYDPLDNELLRLSLMLHDYPCAGMNLRQTWTLFACPKRRVETWLPP